MEETTYLGQTEKPKKAQKEALIHLNTSTEIGKKA